MLDSPLASPTTTAAPVTVPKATPVTAPSTSVQARLASAPAARTTTQRLASVPQSASQRRILSQLQRRHHVPRQTSVHPQQTVRVNQLRDKVNVLQARLENEFRLRQEAEKKTTGLREATDRALALEQRLEECNRERERLREKAARQEEEIASLREAKDKAEVERQLAQSSLGALDSTSTYEVHVPFRVERLPGAPQVINLDSNDGLESSYTCYDDPANNMQCLHLHIKARGEICRLMVRGRKRKRKQCIIMI